MKLRLYLGQKQAEFLQDYQSLGLVVSQALGGKKGSGTSNSPTDAAVPRTKEEMQAAFKSVFG